MTVNKITVLNTLELLVFEFYLGFFTRFLSPAVLQSVFVQVISIT